MSERITHQMIAFDRPFPVKLLDHDQSAGIYEVETIEELIEGLSFPAYRRISTSIRLPDGPHSHQVVPIAPSVVAMNGRPVTSADAL